MVTTPGPKSAAPEWLGQRIEAAVRGVVGVQNRVALHEPLFGGREKEYLAECIDSTFVSYVGAFVGRFETMLAEATGMKHAVALVNGTAALRLGLLLAGVRPGDEVLIPALTFVATANAAAHLGAVPHLVDSAPLTLGMDPARLADHLSSAARLEGDTCMNRRTGRPIRAVVPMHTFGHPVDMAPLAELAARHRLALVEDAAESLGSLYQGRFTGHWSLFSILSFNGNKIVTTGGGGALLTDDDRLAAAARHVSTTAKAPHPFAFFHDQVGYNDRMPNVNAALGCAQMEQLSGFLERKRELAHRYQKAFDGMDGVSFVFEPSQSRSNYWLNAILLSPENRNRRDEVLNYLNAHGLLCRPAWTPMHQLPMFSACPRMDLGVAEDIAGRLINLPSSAGLIPEKEGRVG
jgi:perosamine synthetase